MNKTHAFCHPEGVFTPLPSAKNVKTDRQDPVHLCVGTWIFPFFMKEGGDRRRRWGSCEIFEHLVWLGWDTRPRLDKCFTLSCRPRRKGGVGKAAIFPSIGPRETRMRFVGDYRRGGPRSGGEGENCGKSIRVKIAKAHAHWDSPRFYPLQENQGFFATHFFTKMKKFFGGFPPFFNFANCPKLVAKKPWFFYDVHE